MEEEIRKNINDPLKLEELYRKDRDAFSLAFEEISAGSEQTDLIRFWKIRLESGDIEKQTKSPGMKEILVTILACVIAGFLIKLRSVFNLGISEDLFYERNAFIIAFLGLTLYFIGTRKLPGAGKIILMSALFLIPALYINLLPRIQGSAPVNLVYIHMPLLMWFIFGLIYIDFDLKNISKRVDFIKFNGDLAIMSAIIVIAGGIMTGLTIGLFAAIGLRIQQFYMENIVVIGMVCVAVVATFVIKNYMAVTNKLAPIVANIFSPLVLITAVIYLVAWLTSGKNPYTDREFLLTFNLMLAGVMAIILFSATESSLGPGQKYIKIILFALSIVAVIIDMIALSAIFYRLGTFGITPNRLAVLGSNILILVNIILIIADLYKVNFKGKPIASAGLTISKYLPVYLAWIIIVIFLFPFVFGMK